MAVDWDDIRKKPTHTVTAPFDMALDCVSLPQATCESADGVHERITRGR